MLATLAEPPLTGKGLVFEPKYDGIRALVHLAPGPPADIRIWSRLGNDKTAQFPAVVRALEPLARRLRGPLFIDGEIVALDSRGRPAGFQRLQGRIHVKGSHDIDALDRAQPTAFIAFDLLRDGPDDVRGLPLKGRRERLEGHLAGCLSETLRVSEQVAADGRALATRARQEQWEGLIVKEASSPYQSGRRSPSWRKMKLVNEEELVVCGWTEPRQHPIAVRGPAPRRLRRPAARTAADLRRAHRHGVRPEGARSRLEAPGPARGPRVPLSGPHQDQRTCALGAAGAGRAGAVHRVDRRSKAAAPGVSGSAGRQARGRGDAPRRTAGRSRRSRRNDCAAKGRRGQANPPPPGFRPAILTGRR